MGYEGRTGKRLGRVALPGPVPDLVGALRVVAGSTYDAGVVGIQRPS